jgi:hypothetical protein
VTDNKVNPVYGQPAPVNVVELWQSTTKDLEYPKRVKETLGGSTQLWPPVAATYQSGALLCPAPLLRPRRLSTPYERQGASLAYLRLRQYC